LFFSEVTPQPPPSGGRVLEGRWEGKREEKEGIKGEKGRGKRMEITHLLV